jgi:hypothetical protein
MSKNGLRIRRAIKELAKSEPEILSGTVVAGSLNTGLQTVNILVSDSSRQIEGVSLSSISGNGNGLIIVPKDNSNVIIGSVDGFGAWTVLKTNELKQVLLKIGDALLDINGTDISVKQGDTVMQLTETAVKIGTSSESMFDLLKDLVDAIKTITVAGTPIDGTATTNLTLLSSRINNLLTA